MRTPREFVAHLDTDCFYVSAERVRFPFLQNKPVGVLGNQGECVIAKSYKLKSHGVDWVSRPGTPSPRAWGRAGNPVPLPRPISSISHLARRSIPCGSLGQWPRPEPLPAAKRLGLDEMIKEGNWQHIDHLIVDVPASLGFENGVWLTVRQGLRGLLVPDERRLAVSYLICEPASHYYRVMTKSSRMPVLIDQ